uniref:Putative ovule protein n=1 Tax=Solanum chacoense TaxID=4108 RepID=A0A0V0GFG8_SOLCH
MNVERCIIRKVIISSLFKLNNSENEGLRGIPNEPLTLFSINTDALIEGIFVEGSIGGAIGGTSIGEDIG